MPANVDFPAIETCCCNHGGRCTCSHKKESGLDPVPEIDPEKVSNKEAQSQRPRPPVRRRRANTVHSDGPLTFDQHGNHIKPTQKHSKIASKCGPYQLNRVNSMHSAGSLRSRSPDLLGDNSQETMVGAATVMSAHQQRRVKSEAASPLMTGTPGLQLHSQLPPLDLSGIKYPTYMPNGNFDMFNGSAFSEQDGPMFSAGLSAASVDWSHIELPDRADDNFAPSSYSQACGQSFNGMFDWGAGSEQAPTLAATTSTSGEVSEVEDNLISGDIDLEGFRSADAGYIRSNQLFPTDLGTIDYDSFVKHSSNKFGPPPSSLDDSGPLVGASFNFDNDPVFWGQQFNDDIATYESADGVPMNTDPWNSQ